MLHAHGPLGWGSAEKGEGGRLLAQQPQEGFPLLQAEPCEEGDLAGRIVAPPEGQVVSELELSLREIPGASWEGWEGVACEGVLPLAWGRGVGVGVRVAVSGLGFGSRRQQRGLSSPMEAPLDVVVC